MAKYIISGFSGANVVVQTVHDTDYGRDKQVRALKQRVRDGELTKITVITNGLGKLRTITPDKVK